MKKETHLKLVDDRDLKPAVIKSAYKPVWERENESLKASVAIDRLLCTHQHGSYKTTPTGVVTVCGRCEMVQAKEVSCAACNCVPPCRASQLRGNRFGREAVCIRCARADINGLKAHDGDFNNPQDTLKQYTPQLVKNLP